MSTFLPEQNAPSGEPRAQSLPLTGLGLSARFLVGLMLGYWFLFDLLAPVINVDSLHYNLARVELALRGGLFNNSQWTSLFQVCYPWSFDAVHLPSLLLGWGFGLPSFLCLLGTVVIVWRLVCSRQGPEAAWFCALGLLSLFTVVQQASSTKTDIAVLFTVAVWVYAQDGYRRERRLHHLLMMGLSLGFLSGSKVFGVCFGFCLGLLGLWGLRHELRRLLIYVAACLVSLVLWGSLETYVESWRLFGSPLGPPVLVASSSNSDGLSGAAANLCRYSASLLYAGPVGQPWGRSNAGEIAFQTKRFLGLVGLRDKGGVGGYSDTRFEVLHLPQEEYCGYGPVGTCALLALFLSMLWWRPSELWWQAAALGLGAWFLLCFLLGYDIWNLRYLITTVSAGTVSFVLLVWRLATGRLAVFARTGLLVLLGGAALAAPFLSQTKRPSDLVSACLDRRRFECVNAPVSYEILEALRRGHRADPKSRAYVVVTKISPVLMYLDEPEFPIVPLSREEFERRLHEGWVRPGDWVAEDGVALQGNLVLQETVSATNPFSPHAPPLVRRIYRVPSRPAP